MIGDYNFNQLKDIASVFLKYKNKNSYTSPELLKNNKTIGNVVTEIEGKHDVYSFGILLWELYNMTIPFNVKLTTLYDYVAVQNYRPEIGTNMNRQISELIRKCWDVDPMSRPNMVLIINTLNNVQLDN